MSERDTEAGRRCDVLKHALTGRRRQERVPPPHGDVARALAAALAHELPMDALSFGEGTVLAARWQHRKSFDVDLFCDPQAFAAVDAAGHQRIERRLAAIVGCDAARSWSDPVAVYTEIHGIEATVFPRTSGPAGDSRTELAGSALRLQGSDEILYGKILHRLVEAQTVEVCDVYDIASARMHDPDALRRVGDRLGPGLTGMAAALLSALPAGWTRRSDKPLVEPAHAWDEDTMVAAARGGLQHRQALARNRAQGR